MACPGWSVKHYYCKLIITQARLVIKKSTFALTSAASRHADLYHKLFTHVLGRRDMRRMSHKDVVTLLIDIVRAGKAGKKQQTASEMSRQSRSPVP